jgi:hypothetical protein
MVAQVRTKEDAQEMTYIYKIASTGWRSGYLGRIAYKRMKKGDFCNIPKNTRKFINKQIDKTIEKHLKGYDINAE